LHVELEDLFQQLRRDDLLLLFAALPCLVGRRLRLLFQLDAFGESRYCVLAIRILSTCGKRR